MTTVDRANSLLLELYSRAEGSTSACIPALVVAEEIGVSRQDAIAAITYLDDRGFIKVRGIGGIVSLTTMAIDTIERLHPAPQVESERLRYLTASYDAAQGNPWAMLNMWKLGEELGWERGTTTRTFEYLETKGLLKTMAMGGSFRITTDTVDLYERLQADPARATDYSRPSATLAVNLVNSLNHSTITDSIIASPGARIQEGSIMRDKYDVGQAAAVGPGAKADRTIMINNNDKPVDWDALASQLAELRTEVKLAPEAPDADSVDEAAGALLAAEKAAKAKDLPSMQRALAGAGKWVVDVASRVAAPLALAWLEKAWTLK